MSIYVLLWEKQITFFRFKIKVKFAYFDKKKYHILTFSLKLLNQIKIWLELPLGGLFSKECQTTSRPPFKMAAITKFFFLNCQFDASNYT
jgi:hypothetical protein